VGVDFEAKFGGEIGEEGEGCWHDGTSMIRGLEKLLARGLGTERKKNGSYQGH
jgi:hypothetical protein